jgi:hypothetical protein
MDETRFWDLIEAAQADSGGDCERMADLLTERLVALPPQEIVGFAAAMRDRLQEAYRWDLWWAASLLNGWCSDDGFEYFRGWMIAQGRKVFAAALADPDSVADVPTDEEFVGADLECEAILYAPYDAYERATGGEMPAGAFERVPLPELARKEWADEEVERRFPRILARAERLTPRE